MRNPIPWLAFAGLLGMLTPVAQAASDSVQAQVVIIIPPRPAENSLNPAQRLKEIGKDPEVDVSVLQNGNLTTILYTKVSQ
ncbi:MAG: hypothetical protein HYT88_02925 [Candidatus Omnitrophica bacterium]|nr:hypothetical protein [Candidatus Omnitrophota bacterium]MBI2174571.1 hypothetical protein [Candidatus Omnitrophota bacterium]MBI3009830.1 hypothetical protein [Candidatus Omnitrophota bacterium]